MNQNDFMRTYIQTKISGSYVDHNSQPIELLKKSEKEKKLHSLDDITYYCGYKTKYKEEKTDEEEKDAVIFVFSMELSGPSTGSSSSSEKVMTLLDFVCKTLKQIDHRKYSKEPIEGKSRKNIAFLKIIKIIREDDIL